MDIFWSVDDVGTTLAGGALAIGNFDGVHLGHQALIKKAHHVKGRNNCGVLTFSPHPNEVLKKSKSHFYLMTDQEKIEALSRLGVQVAIVQRINEAFLKISPRAFVDQVLVNRLKIKHVVVGEDFSFGNQALGDVDLLNAQGRVQGFITHVVDPVLFKGERCSSTAIRNYLRAGDVLMANGMLGRWFSLGGVVTSGQKKGGVLGFSTANLPPHPGLALCHGVYATVTRVPTSSGHQDLLSATNVGVRPTVAKEDKVVIETHCIDREIDLYDQFIRVFFVEYLRKEIRFASIEALQEQVRQDCDLIRQRHRLHPDRFRVKD